MFVLKGNSSNGQNGKVERTVEFKIRVLELKINKGETSKEALRIACSEYDCTPTKAMVDHPASIYHGYKKSIEKKVDGNDKKTIDLLIKAKLVEEKED